MYDIAPSEDFYDPNLKFLFEEENYLKKLKERLGPNTEIKLVYANDGFLDAIEIKLKGKK